MASAVASASFEVRELTIRTFGTGFCLLQFAQDLKAVHLRHFDIERNDIRFQALDLFQRINPVGCSSHYID